MRLRLPAGVLVLLVALLAPWPSPARAGWNGEAVSLGGTEIHVMRRPEGSAEWSLANARRLLRWARRIDEVLARGQVITVGLYEGSGWDARLCRTGRPDSCRELAGPDTGDAVVEPSVLSAIFARVAEATGAPPGRVRDALRLAPRLYAVRVGTYADHGDARRRAEQVDAHADRLTPGHYAAGAFPGSNPVAHVVTRGRGGGTFVVVAGAFADRRGAETLRSELAALGFAARVVGL